MLQQAVFLKELEELVNIDSGTYCAAGTTAVAQWFAKRFRAMGWQEQWYEPVPEKLGQSLLVAPDLNKPFSLLVLCHVDTVFPAGEVAKRPFSRVGDRLLGPGVADMKSGCLFTLYAFEQWQAQAVDLKNPAVFFNAEHEISCPNTRSIIEALSSKSRIVVSAEPTRANGAHVRQRKGIIRYTFNFAGKSAHSGNNPQDGVCAVTEMAHWILYLQSLANPVKGISVNTGMVSGGTSVNSIPDSAELRVDMRMFEQEDAKVLDATVRAKAQTPFNPAIGLTLTGGVVRPPMRPDSRTDILCRLLEEVGQQHGVSISWATAGGGSDASFASAMGIPALCGLAGVAGGLHTQAEYLEMKDIEARFAVYKDMIHTFALHTC